MDNEIPFKEYHEAIESLFSPKLSYTFLVGAGISMDSPSNIPSALKIVRNLLELCAPPEEIENLVSLKKLRFELVVEKIQSEIDENLRFLDYLEQVKEPNLIHYFLANAITRGNYVLTTNFDYLIEYALIKMLDNQFHNDIIPVITKQDYVFYQDPQNLVKANRYPLYKIHGSKRNIITNMDTKESLITTISSLGKEREEGETFAIEPYKKPAVFNLMKQRSLVVFGYSGSDDFDIGPTLNELPFLKNLIWVEHKQENQIEITNINDLDVVSQKRELSQVEKLLQKIAITGNFNITLLKTNTKNFIQTKLWDLFLPYISIKEVDEMKLIKSVSSFFEWIKPLYEGITMIQKYKLSIELYYSLKELNATIRCSEKGLKLAEEENDYSAKSYFLNYLGLVNQITGSYDKALEYYSQALQIDDQMEDSMGKATDLNNIGSIYLTRGEYDLATNTYKQGLEIAERIEDSSGMIATLNNLGRIKEIKGELDLALKNYQKAKRISERIGYLSRKATLLNNIGRIYGLQNNFDMALQQYEEALHISDQLGDLYGKIILLNNIGRIYDEYHDYDRALLFYTQALELSEQLGDLSKKAGCINNIGSLYLAQGKSDKALEKYIEALNIEERLGDPLMMIIYLNNIGMIYSNREEYNIALVQYNKALDIAKEIGDLSKKALILTKIAMIKMIKEEYHSAMEKYEEAIPIFGKIGELTNKAASLSNIGKIYEKFQNYSKAIDIYEEAFQIDDQLGDLMGKASDLYNLGRIYKISGKNHKALDSFEECLNIFTQLNQEQYVNVIKQEINDLKNKVGTKML
ncbi:MAG: tetratricopeptide repeat protein [Promethearchaeota archaeon]